MKQKWVSNYSFHNAHYAERIKRFFKECDYADLEVALQEDGRYKLIGFEEEERSDHLNNFILGFLEGVRYEQSLMKEKKEEIETKEEKQSFVEELKKL